MFTPSFRPAAAQALRGHRAPAHYHPARRASRISQAIQVTPEISAPINIGLGSLPVVIGSFAGSAVMFVLGAQVPSLKPFTTLTAVGLAGFGLYNIFAKRTIPGGEELPGASSPASGADSSVSPPIAATSEEAFPLITGRILSPTEFQTVEQSPFAATVPIRVRLSNPSSAPVTFDMTFEILEIPEPFGSESSNNESTRVSLGAGETRDFDIPITLTTWDWSVNMVDVYLTARKARTSGGDGLILDSVHFVID